MVPEEEDGGVEGGVFVGCLQEAVEVVSGGEGVVGAFGGGVLEVDEGVAGEEGEAAEGFVEGAEGADAGVAGVGFGA
ncbi:hypothetical protein DEGR_38640 (plasmid) [Deinococcus grandis]|nr:hypothetical protein DEGR_38640 [Deinococcus grandis]